MDAWALTLILLAPSLVKGEPPIHLIAGTLYGAGSLAVCEREAERIKAQRPSLPAGWSITHRCEALAQPKETT